MQSIQTMQIGQPEASDILVERTPVKKGTKLSNKLSSDDAVGLGWLLYEEVWLD